MNVTDIIGTSGVTLILGAYVLLIAGLLKKNNPVYLGMNFLGASLACFASVLLEYWPFIILEGVWAGVSLFAIAGFVKPKKVA